MEVCVGLDAYLGDMIEIFIYVLSPIFNNQVLHTYKV